MKLAVAKKKNTSKKLSVHLCIGDDGAVAILSQNDGTVVQKIFCKSTGPEDSLKLKTMLMQNSEARISVYADTAEQLYIQKTLPAVNKMMVDKIAQTKIQKEFQKNFLRAYVQICRNEFGRKDWLYTFIGIPMNSYFSTWIRYISEFQNIITGIYLLPVELIKVSEAIDKNYNSEKPKIDKASFATSVIDLFKGKKHTKQKNKWHIVLVQSKSNAGYRQVAYMNARIVFSRIISKFDGEEDVIAGNIEQETQNAVEYIKRLGFDAKTSVLHIHTIIPSEISNHMRDARFADAIICKITPFEFATMAKLNNATTAQDKFADPTILALLAKNKSRVISLYTPEIKKIKIIASIALGAKYLLMLCIAVCLSLTSYFTYQYTDNRAQIDVAKKTAKRLVDNFTKLSKTQTEQLKGFDLGLKIEHLIEVVDTYTRFSSSNFNYISTANKMGEILPSFIKIKKLKWAMHESRLFEKTEKGNDGYSLSGKFILYKPNLNTTILSNAYSSLSRKMQEKFKYHSIKIANLPETFSVQDLKAPIELDFTLMYPKSHKGG